MPGRRRHEPDTGDFAFEGPVGQNSNAPWTRSWHPSRPPDPEPRSSGPIHLPEHRLEGQRIPGQARSVSPRSSPTRRRYVATSFCQGSVNRSPYAHQLDLGLELGQAKTWPVGQRRSTKERKSGKVEASEERICRLRKTGYEEEQIAFTLLSRTSLISTHISISSSLFLALEAIDRRSTGKLH